MCLLQPPGYPKRKKREPLPYCVGVQVDMSLSWSHRSNCRFCSALAVHYIIYITKTCLYNFDPRKPHVYIVKLGFTGVYIIFHIAAQNIDCGYSLEPPRRGGSNEYPQSMFWAEIWKNIRVFYPKSFGFWRQNKFSIYLNRRVFVMLINHRGFIRLFLLLTCKHAMHFNPGWTLECMNWMRHETS